MRTLHRYVHLGLGTRLSFRLAENTKHRQILKTVGMPHRKLHTMRCTETPFRCSHTFFSSHNKRFCFAMNNAASVALLGHIA